MIDAAGDKATRRRSSRLTESVACVVKDKFFCVLPENESTRFERKTMKSCLPDWKMV